MRLKIFIITVFSFLFVSTSLAEQSKPAIVIRASSTITTNEDGTVFEDLQASGGIFVLEITELGVAQTLSLRLQMQDPITSNWINFQTGTAWATEGTKLHCVWIPECTLATINSADRWSMKLPFKWRFHYEVNNGTNATFSVALIRFPE